ncbi:hypothetical protein LTS08_007392 [Lithohypha guttulata]|uniref:Tetraspanin n=1 Tax=Lithohypha guttulata TaxID=1690604 RepID=A0AAN7YDN1_9EURO|nr:hypothetical protein LTR51_002228 [Lithohypha guttulata]KAK5090047.1 hypothetical protein LTR05_000216 [Lithohypha guttulata]KAK5096902.1 hypothetical protein LTS08_007392 [Lithohypha guttulata]
MVNSGLMFLSFIISIHAWMIVAAALFTLSIGLEIWFSTLQTRRNLTPIWNRQSTFVQSMLQFKFKCCGYDDTNVFIQDGTCPNVADATRHGGCIGPFSVFANKFLDVVFTTFFGFVAVDMLVLLSVLCVIKERKEQIRYQLIDEKSRVSI